MANNIINKENKQQSRKNSASGTHKRGLPLVFDETTLAESEKIFRSLFENAPIGILHSLPEGRFIRVNHFLANMLGYESPEELVSLITNISAQIYEDSERRINDMVGILKSEGWYTTKNRYRRKNGSILNIKLTARKVLNSDGMIAYYEGFVEDLGE
jgi:PAS domain S-box-containing protein